MTGAHLVLSGVGKIDHSQSQTRHPLSLGEGELRIGELGSIVSIGIVCWKSQIKSYGGVSIERQAVKDLQHPVLMRQ